MAFVTYVGTFCDWENLLDSVTVDDVGADIAKFLW